MANSPVAAPSPDAAIPPEMITVETPSGGMPAHLWRPTAGPATVSPTTSPATTSPATASPATSGPALVLLHEIFGVGRYMRARAADLAALGYTVLAPELYWRLGDQAIETARRDDLEQAMAVASRLEWDSAVADAVAALGYLRDRPDGAGAVGVIGFCLGGGLAFAAAAVARPDVLVSYYGSSLPSLLDRVGDVRAPSLHHFGLADDYLPPETVRTLEAALTTGPSVRVETYPGANHAFDNPSPLFHHPEAAGRAWRITTEFLAERLPPGVS